MEKLSVDLGLRPTRVISNVLQDWKSILTTDETEKVKMYCANEIFPDGKMDFQSFDILPNLDEHS